MGRSVGFWCGLLFLSVGVGEPEFVTCCLDSHCLELGILYALFIEGENGAWEVSHIVCFFTRKIKTLIPSIEGYKKRN